MKYFLMRLSRSRPCDAVLPVGVGLVLAMLLTACSGASGSAEKGELTTVKSGTITVAITAYMPYDGYEGGKLTGLDGDIINKIAGELGYKVDVQVMDFAGMLTAVQTNRVDMGASAVFWKPDRAATGLFTDPPYYSPMALAVADGNTYTKASQLEGKDIGTVTGYSWVESIKDIPGAKLHTYPDANGVFNDLRARRINVGMLDPLVTSYTEKKNPELAFKTQYITPPTKEEIAQHPGWLYLSPAMTGFYVAKQSKDLEKAFSQKIREMYTDGSMTELIKKWGGDPDTYLLPSPGMLETRRGADRDATWTLPTIK
ncbi:MAG TPA: ABC transporter substrate-binding protein [Nonomuraea sp.]|nr:ABC transporter substrate-binding protein [Nonomuraea sp.]